MNQDITPQPPPKASDERPIETLARLLEESEAIPTLYGIPLDDPTPEGRVEAVLARIADLTAQVADLQGRLALAHAAMKLAISEETSMCYSPGERAMRNAIAALAPTVAEHEARLKRQGAAEELERWADDDTCILFTSTRVRMRDRAAELRRQDA